ncbi:S-adenosyl-L-methionine-dependent methyltransferase [Xylariaceae sp. AK1471]|nr:S-adenosyl-L-methionine-dependent methyltransferase [Xylariaceae sp. AK1471]
MELLTPLYEIGHVVAGSHAQLSNIMDCLGHVNPNLRSLEIGAGTGAATPVVVKVLTGQNNIKRYADYTFTDISAGFLTAATDILSGYRDVNYSILDIEQNPLQNGYELVYDVVLACEVIHATASMDRTLVHCRCLLKPGGKLVLVETTQMRVLLGLFNIIPSPLNYPAAFHQNPEIRLSSTISVTMPMFDAAVTSEKVVATFASQVKGRVFVITGAGQPSDGASIAVALAKASPA